MSVKRKSTDGLENESTGKKHPKTSKVKLEKSSDVKPQSPADKAKVSKSSQLKPNVIKSKHHDKPNKQDKKNKPTIKENGNEKPKKIRSHYENLRRYLLCDSKFFFAICNFWLSFLSYAAA